ncbi:MULTISPECIES: dihydroxyacetone kinase subunit DhaK [Clostridium]|jgi:dihydroxyacetone kinase-like protein|uniref:phosphoenolpyruvate--glycerone phosphotransferase n=1 Tax=Clostridium cochlearium TaxID=1494 RepID=A0A240AGG6_CLOCO|nr:MULTISPECIES: dihydroxyacetone kinase subunit DhaK [Clostridium]MBV1818740.1 dihydroxyacetone kinase subunit DhaK [Bacteroidales bacterium MSK.15.36]NSJ91120.1 dihydroxyacetone kinase subunit DhaK [Coprococcus sp. MSK.21.13]MBE6043521.1 dihydroxyacetone kinase subunit DhaK [Clostridium thermopalmarium]MBE6064887.1 dihydroxyacetone kinase subunit DhaK [Clostridium cochlearium]MBU5269610.1 dihydroxyacetone kinase subunit DhaK [Clostridium cochlearium]
MKKLINNVDYVVEDMLDGMVKAYSNKIRKLDVGNIVVRKESPIKNKVAIVSGGGSGHEPAHGGYVGKGMLDAAVAGAVFTSPTPDQVFEAIKAVDGGSGVLLVIKNYSGDVMNFEMAKDMAEMEGIQVESVIVNDDVAVEDSTYTTGRRGIAGTVFIHKIAGAKAETGASLEEVKAVAEKVISNVKSMGMALTPCIVPAAGKPSFTLAENEMEIGIGIHGEPGTHREELKSADDVTEHLVNKILDDITIEKGEEVAVMVNGLGSTPLMELFIVNKKVHEILENRGIKVYETFVGEYMTSLEMAGCSVTLLKLDEELKELLDATADTPAMKVL